MRKPGLIELPVITTERLVLRALKKTDARQIVVLRSDERITRYLGSAPKITTTEATIFVKNIKDGVKTNEWFYWAVTLKSKDKLIGTVCLWHIDNAKSQADTGYELHPDWQGQGLMREALAAVIAFGFNNLTLQQIRAITHRDNSRSLALLASMGFIEVNHESAPYAANQICMSLILPTIR